MITDSRVGHSCATSESSDKAPTLVIEWLLDNGNSEL